MYNRITITTESPPWGYASNAVVTVERAFYERSYFEPRPSPAPLPRRRETTPADLATRIRARLGRTVEPEQLKDELGRWTKVAQRCLTLLAALDARRALAARLARLTRTERRRPLAPSARRRRTCSTASAYAARPPQRVS